MWDEQIITKLVYDQWEYGCFFGGHGDISDHFVP